MDGRFVPYGGLFLEEEARNFLQKYKKPLSWNGPGMDGRDIYQPMEGNL